MSLFQNESKCETINENAIDLHENETTCRTHFHKKGFTLGLVLKQRNRDWKWPGMDFYDFICKFSRQF